MSKQVLSIEQMQHLKKLGVDVSKASMCWRRKTRDWKGETKVGRWGLTFNHPIIVSNFETYEDVTTFTLQDILDLLPKEIIPHDFPYSLFIDYQEMRIAYCFVDREGMCWINPTFDIEDDIIDAAYNMLCWCAENGYIKTDKKED